MSARTARAGWGVAALGLAGLSSLSGCGGPPSRPAPATAPLITLEGQFAPDAMWPEIILAPQVACDGQAVLAPLERIYDDQRTPVQAAIFDRRGHTVELLELDALPDGDAARAPAAVQRRLDAANAALATRCWRPLTADPPATYARWQAPTLRLSHDDATVDLPRPGLVPPAVPDDDCPPTTAVGDVFVDEGTRLALIELVHEVHDNCGHRPPTWIVADLPPATATRTFVCGLPSRAAFDRAVAELGPAAAQPLGTCRAERIGERLRVSSGTTTIYTAKDGGATWAFDPAFAVDGVRPGDDARRAVAAARRRGLDAIHCVRAEDQVDCVFTSPTRAECTDDRLEVLIRAEETTTDPEFIREPEELRGRLIVGVPLDMPC